MAESIDYIFLYNVTTEYAERHHMSVLSDKVLDI